MVWAVRNVIGKDGCVIWINHLCHVSTGNDLGAAPEKIRYLAIRWFF